MAEELRDADTWLYETLAARTAFTTPSHVAYVPGGIWAGEVVPQGNTTPYLRYQFQADAANLVIGGYRYMDRITYLVAAVVPLGTGNPLKKGSDILREADAALRGRIGTAMPGGGTVHGVVSRGLVRYPDPPERPVFLHYGRLYEVQVSGGG